MVACGNVVVEVYETVACGNVVVDTRVLVVVSGGSVLVM